ncbi:sensor histidine kinase [Nitrogeniibacter mangrovi]|uniref:histidine kinase n=1 Tax=Nitrogeniibacter mangrovi TaxID=2016596 RepID=A0A6C1B3Q6_9RHOO|nr:sensor histidine kinase [Nitrogeniibacter mangrovi]QID17485.1 sensor histidine kinase [Nitrogeniibacter mangrovi]
MSRNSGSLRDRVTTLVATVAVLGFIAGTALWCMLTRDAIHEEVEAATKVSEQWLRATGPLAYSTTARLDMISAVGRLRANELEVTDEDGQVLYTSPPPTYKAGRDAPAWFAALIGPKVESRHWEEGPLRLHLIPDTSRAILDAWDNLWIGAGWAVAGIILLSMFVRQATHRIVAPLSRLRAALGHSATGRFDRRVEPMGNAEFDELADAYNHMAENLAQTLVRNARLEEDKRFARALNERMEETQRALARELHDEFGQGITALRAIAGGIVQRSADNAALHGSAQALMAVSSQLQDNVRGILDRLRDRAPETPAQLDRALEDYVTQWAACYPAMKVIHHVDAMPAALPEDFRLSVLRLAQEALTNVARHADARKVELRLEQADGAIELTVSDDGRGFDPMARTERYGLAGMRERTDLWHGTLSVSSPPRGGCTIEVNLPLPNVSKSTPPALPSPKLESDR